VINCCLVCGVPLVYGVISAVEPVCYPCDAWARDVEPLWEDDMCLLLDVSTK
jgi:hypothetical protein